MKKKWKNYDGEIGFGGCGNPFEVKGKYDAIVLAVPHRMFRDMPPEAYAGLLRNGDKPAVLVDVKGILRDVQPKTGVLYWSL